MVKWVRLFRGQYLGFWILGLVLFALQEVPYMVMPLFSLENNPIMTMQESSAALDFCEKALGVLSVVIMTFIVRENAPVFRIGKGVCKAGFFLAIAVLLLNYIGWGLCFTGHQSLEIMMFFLVALPPLYYVFIGVWRENWILLLTGVAFEIVHFAHVYGNLKL